MFLSVCLFSRFTGPKLWLPVYRVQAYPSPVQGPHTPSVHASLPCSSLFNLDVTEEGLSPSQTCSNLLPSATKLRRLCLYTCLSFCSQGGVVPQHALQVVSEHALQQGGVLSQHALQQGGAWSGGLFPGESAAGGVCSWGVPAPGVCVCGDPPGSRRLLLRMVRILLECFLVHYVACIVSKQVVGIRLKCLLVTTCK